jgi:hypothetical protein
MQYFLITTQEMISGVEFKGSFIIQATQETVDELTHTKMLEWRGDGVYNEDEEYYDYGEVTAYVSGSHAITDSTAKELIAAYIIPEL